MKKIELNKEHPILKQAKEKVARYKSMPLNVFTDVEFLERFIDEYTLLALKVQKQEKQIRLLKILLERKG